MSLIKAPIHWRKRKQCHAFMWAMLTQQIDPVASWIYLFAWAELGGKAADVKSLEPK